MTSNVVDLVKINVLSTGTGSFSLGTNATGYRGVEALTDNQEYGYSVQSGSAWEVGRGTYFLATHTLTRAVVYSSNGGEAVPFGSNAQVAFVALAEDLSALNLSAAAEAAAASAAAASSSASAAAASAAEAATTNALLGGSGGAALVGADDGATGTLFSTVQGFIAKILSSAGSSVIGFLQAGVGAVMRSIQAKLRELPVTPYDFGAKGDNATDDLAAFQAAITHCVSTQARLWIKEGAYVLSGKLTIPSTFDITCDETAAMRWTNPSDCGILLDFQDNADTLASLEFPQLFSSAINSSFSIPGYSVTTNGSYNLASRVGNAIHLKGGNRIRIDCLHAVGWDSAYLVESTPSAVVANVDLSVNTIDFCVKGIATYAGSAASSGVVALTFTANTVWAKYPIYFDGTNQSVAASEFKITGQAFTNEPDGSTIYGQTVAGKVDTCKIDVNWASSGYQADSVSGTPTTLICPFLAGSASSNGATTDGNATLGYWAGQFCEITVGPVMGFGGGVAGASPIPVAGNTIRIRDVGGYNRITMRNSDNVATTPIATTATAGEANYNGGVGGAQYSRKVLCSSALSSLGVGSSITHYVYHQTLSKSFNTRILLTQLDDGFQSGGINAFAAQETVTNNRQAKVTFKNNGSSAFTGTLTYFLDFG